MGDFLDALADLVLRNDCLCCGRIIGAVDRLDGDDTASPGRYRARSSLCVDCAVELDRAPERITTTSESTMIVPIYTSGPYGGAHRALVLAAKDHLRTPALDVMAGVWQAGWEYLAAGGVLPSPHMQPVVVIPAPTRPSAIRDRGGDIVSRAAEVMAKRYPQVAVVPLAIIDDSAPDSVGLSRAQRRQSLAEHIRLDPVKVGRVRRFLEAGGQAIIVDDVCTTGATIAQLSLALAAHSIRPVAALTMCQA